MYVDTETGTIVNGPIYWLADHHADAVDEMSDSEVIDFAYANGACITN